VHDSNYNILAVENGVPSISRDLKFETAVVKWPSNKINVISCTSFNFLGLSFELIHIPVGPQELALQETRFWTCKPDTEACWQRNFTILVSTLLFGIGYQLTMIFKAESCDTTDGSVHFGVHHTRLNMENAQSRITNSHIVPKTIHC
jgi:hypothetical protein